MHIGHGPRQGTAPDCGSVILSRPAKIIATELWRCCRVSLGSIDLLTEHGNRLSAEKTQLHSHIMTSFGLGMCWNINLFTKLTSHATWQLTDCWVSNKCQFHWPVGVECRFYSIEILACRGLVTDLVLNTLGLESVLSLEKFSYKTLRILFR